LIDSHSFVLGIIVGAGASLNVVGVIYWSTVARMRREDVAFRVEQRRRIDDMAERQERMYDQSRRDLGLPPRIVS